MSRLFHISRFLQKIRVGIAAKEKERLRKLAKEAKQAEKVYEAKVGRITAKADAVKSAEEAADEEKARIDNLVSKLNEHLTAIKDNIADIERRLKEMMKPADNKWGSTDMRFGADGIFFEINYKTNITHHDHSAVPCKTTAEMLLPLRYLRKIKDLIVGPLTIQFNNGSPRKGHGQRVVFKSSNMTLVLCKLITART